MEVLELSPPTMQHKMQAEAFKSDWVVANTFFVIRKTDGEIIGMIDIRHSINHELKMALEFEKSTGLKKVMLGCYSDNIASIRTIERCKGKRTE